MTSLLLSNIAHYSIARRFRTQPPEIFLKELNENDSKSLSYLDNILSQSTMFSKPGSISGVNRLRPEEPSL